MKTYIVEQPYRGVAVYQVEANSAQEALDKVNSPDYLKDDCVQCIDQLTTWMGKAVIARLDKPRKPKE